MMRPEVFVLRRIVLFLLSVTIAWPQASTGRVSGTVTDQTGAAIPNAQVVLDSAATRVTSTTRANEVGFYLFPGVVPGPYRLSLDFPGMERYEASFTVQVAQSVVIDPVLKPGQTQTTVEVRDITPMVVTDSPIVRSTVEHVRIQQLPINGRVLNALLQTMPGAEGAGTTADGGHRTFGLPGQAQEWIFDGAVVTDRRFNMSLFSQSPGVGMVQEFTVDTSGVSAKHSRPSNVIISSRSGTSRFHGSAYETHRNNGIGLARTRTDFFSKPPQLIRNEYGANAGGPVVIPKVYNGRNRTFWFFNFEPMRQRSSTTTGYNVPTTAMRNGDFSELRDSQGRLLTLYDPWTTDTRTWARQPFSHGGRLNVIDPKRISPVAKYLFEITPLPSTNVNPLVDVNYWGMDRNNRNPDTWAFRIDHRFSDRDQIYFRGSYGYYPSNRSNNSGCPCGPMMLNQVAGWKFVLDGEKSAATSWVHTFSPTFFSEFVAGARYRIGGGYTGTDNHLDTNWYDKLGMPNPFGVKDWPQFKSTGLGNYIISVSGTDRANETFYTFDENLTKIHGRHEFLFGGHFRKDVMNVIPNNAGASNFTFDTLATALYDSRSSTPSNPLATPQTGQNLGNMFLGVSTYQASLIRSWYYLRGGEAALYFQDNFKLTSRLTVNLGLRWETWRPYREKNNTLAGFNRASKSTVLGTDMNTLYSLGLTIPSIVARYQSLGWKYESWKDAGLPQNLTHARNKNIGPRLGFAYRALDGKNSFVVRGGYSLTYFSLDQSSWVGAFTSNTPFAGTFTNNPNDAAQSPDGLPNYLLRSVPVYVNGVNDSKAIDLSQPRGISRGSATASYFSPNLPDSRVHSWNLTLEKEVMASTVVRARYVGSHVGNLSNWDVINSPTPDYIWYATTGQPKPTGEYASVALRPYDQQVLGTVQEYRNSGFANNQALDFELERRFDRGYAFQASYVITNALTTGSAANVPPVNQFMPGAVPADYDERNAFLNYRRDTAIPKHKLRWNWLIDLPFGKGKPLGGNAGSVLDKFIGGWQIAGIGSFWTNYFSLPTGNWNITGEKIQLYGYKYPIQDCRGGSCVPGYLWWNGYIPANQINSLDRNGNPNGYMGIPAEYKPAVTPLIPWPAAPDSRDPNYAYFGTNNVWIPLKNGTTQRIGYDTGLHPWRNQYLPGVRQWAQDASLFKNIPIRESVNLRFAADFFNVFNHPNNPNTIGGDGFLNTRASGIAARLLQLSLRLDW